MNEEVEGVSGKKGGGGRGWMRRMRVEEEVEGRKR